MPGREETRRYHELGEMIGISERGAQMAASAARRRRAHRSQRRRASAALKRHRLTREASSAGDHIGAVFGAAAAASISQQSRRHDIKRRRLASARLISQARSDCGGARPSISPQRERDAISSLNKQAGIIMAAAAVTDQAAKYGWA